VYAIPGVGAIEIDSLDLVRVKDLREADARSAGMQDLADLLRTLGSGTGTVPTFVYRVCFHLTSEKRLKPPVPTVPGDGQDLQLLLARLRRMDGLGAHGPWIFDTLKQIAQKPGTAARHLAASLKRERESFKIDVRKLKQRGLTVSHEVGYSLTPLGRAVLSALPVSDPMARAAHENLEPTRRRRP